MHLSAGKLELTFDLIVEKGDVPFAWEEERMRIMGSSLELR